MAREVRSRSCRGKRYAAQSGRVGVLGQAPHGHRYIRAAEGEGVARFEIVLEEARVVRQAQWVGKTLGSTREVGRYTLIVPLIAPR